LDPVGLSPADAARGWHDYVTARTAWNHVRSASGILGVALLLVGRQVVIAFSSIMVGIRQDLPGSGGSFQQVKHAAPQRNTGGNRGR
jgi:hypothetical protein